MPYFDKLESSRPSVSEAFEILGEYVGLVRFDGKYTPSGHWALRWTGVYPVTERHQLIRTMSFSRYAEAVTRAIASRAALTNRKPVAVAPSASNTLSVKA